MNSRERNAPKHEVATKAPKAASRPNPPRRTAVVSTRRADGSVIIPTPAKGPIVLNPWVAANAVVISVANGIAIALRRMSGAMSGSAKYSVATRSADTKTTIASATDMKPETPSPMRTTPFTAPKSPSARKVATKWVIAILIPTKEASTTKAWIAYACEYSPTADAPNQRASTSVIPNRDTCLTTVPRRFSALPPAS